MNLHIKAIINCLIILCFTSVCFCSSRYYDQIVKTSENSLSDARSFFIERASKHLGPLKRYTIISVIHKDTVFRKDSLVYDKELSSIQHLSVEPIRGISLFIMLPIEEDTGPNFTIDNMPNHYSWVRNHLFVWREGDDIEEYLVELFREKDLLIPTSEMFPGSGSLNDALPSILFYYERNNPNKYKRVVDQAGHGVKQRE